MNRALEIAQNGLGNVSPNPLVGCVIVHRNVIIGEGWHQKYGEAHAEVNAINSVKNKELLKKSTLYVTLEPCSHFGKTPPCADLIIKHKIPKVIICNLDPFDKVNGAGITRLKKNNIEVVTDVLENKGKEINRRFFTSITKKRPYIILKWAETKDGFTARKNFDSKWISNSESRKLVHKLRAEEDAILVGFNTAKYDNPSITVRDWQGENPSRIVIDKNLSLDRNLNLFDGNVNTICFNSIKNDSIKNLRFIKVDFSNLEEEILHALDKQKIQSIIIEGGSKTIQKFMGKNLWDEAHIFVGNQKFNVGINAPKLEIEPIKEVEVLDDLLKIYRNV